MNFLWPDAVMAAALVPAFLAFYLLIERRHRRVVLRHPGLNPAGSRTSAVSRRWLLLGMFLISLTTLAIALLRPSALITELTRHATIMLVMDVSASMGAKDVQPDRWSVARAAARSLVDRLPDGVRMGIVTAGGNAVTALDPTGRREEILAAIDRIELQQGTAIGSALALALAVIFPDASIDPSALIFGRDAALPPRNPESQGRGAATAGHSLAGSHRPDAIVLITDGQTTSGPDPMEAARLAADLGVRVHTIGVGTAAGELMRIDGWSMRVRLDEALLKRMAATTRGEHFVAVTPENLERIYRSLSAQLVIEQRRTEITAVFCIAAAVLTLVSTALSMLWFKRVLL